MKAALLAAATISTTAFAQIQPVNPLAPPIIGPIDLKFRPQLAPPLACALSSGVIGEKGSAAIVGEKGSRAITGEEGTNAIIGEKGSSAIVGEDGSVATASKRFVGSWNAGGTTTFRHVIFAPPGPVKVMLRGCGSSPSGQTLRIKAEGASLQQSLMATPSGSARSATLIMPRAAPGKLARVPILITIDSPAGNPAAAGMYEVTITR